MVVLIASLAYNVLTTSDSITTVLRGDKGPIVLYIGGYSDVNTPGPRFCRFCGLNLNSPVTISSIRNRNANSLLSRMVECLPRRSRISSRGSRVVGITIVNGPGINGSSLVGGVDNRGEAVISSVTNAAHSSASACVRGGFNGFGVVSATNVEHGDGVISSIRGFDVVETGSTIRETGIYIVVVSTARNFARRSSGMTKVTLRTNGTYVVTIGG